MSLYTGAHKIISTVTTLRLKTAHTAVHLTVAEWYSRGNADNNKHSNVRYNAMPLAQQTYF